MKRLKNSVGIWAFGAVATRFMPEGYHPETDKETMVERTERAVTGLESLADGFEYHYPGEINEDNADRINKALGDKDVYAVALGTFSNPKFADGAFINPDPELRRENMEITKRGIDLAAELGSKFIIWPGGDGYNYLFQADYGQIWDYFIHGIQEVVKYANQKDVPVLLEHKNSEPAMNILMRDMGMSIYVVKKVQELGTDISNLKLNMDWQHLIMNGENLGEYAALLAKEDLLGHQHANSGWGDFDDDNITGASYFMQTLEIAKVLQGVGYGQSGERIGFDLFPYTEDQVEAVRRAVLQWEFIYELASKLDDDALREARQRKDAIRGQEVVYRMLGLDDEFMNRLRDGKLLD